MRFKLLQSLKKASEDCVGGAFSWEHANEYMADLRAIFYEENNQASRERIKLLDRVLEFHQQGRLSISEKFHATLPRELRDIVYNYLWEDPKVRELVRDVLNRWNEPPSFRNTPALPVFIQASYVGLQVAQEALQSAYLQGLGDVRLSVIQNIGKFLDSDALELEMKPIDNARTVIMDVPFPTSERRRVHEGAQKDKREFEASEILDMLEDKINDFQTVTNKSSLRLVLFIHIPMRTSITRTQLTTLLNSCLQIMRSFELEGSRFRLLLEFRNYAELDRVTMEITNSQSPEEEDLVDRIGGWFDNQNWARSYWSGRCGLKENLAKYFHKFNPAYQPLTGLNDWLRWPEDTNCYTFSSSSDT